jgi:hypothetical protein
MVLDSRAAAHELAEALEIGDRAKAEELARQLLAQQTGVGSGEPQTRVIDTATGGAALDRLLMIVLPEQAQRLAEQIVAAAGDHDRNVAEEAAGKLRDLLQRSGLVVDEEMAVKAMRALRNVRAFAELARLGDRLIALGAKDPEIRKLTAQGLIDSGQPHAALGALEELFSATPPAHRQHIDGLGLAGRAFKQVYADVSPRYRTAATNITLRDALANSVLRYERGYLESRSGASPSRDDWTYHGINLVAVLERARRDGVRVHARVDADRLAGEIASAYGANGETAKSAWDFATLGEAYVARNDWASAETWLRRYAEHKDVTAFQLNGTIRQLEEIWQLDGADEAQGRLLYLLKAQLLDKDGGELIVSTGERSQLLQAVTPQGGTMEAYLSDGRPKPVGWLKAGLERANSVALIKTIASGHGFGTGFLVRAGDFIPRLGDMPALLTNAHVLSVRPQELQDPGLPSVHIKKAKVEFTTAGKDVRRTEFLCREVLWDSPRGELDATLVALHPDPVDIPMLAISDKRPEANKSRVIVVGHPGGYRELCVSLYESPLVQIGTKLKKDPPKHEYLHYTNPTIGGNSGSPVFEDGEWEVVGLHHSGPNLQTSKLPKLEEESGEHSVNEGIYIGSIREIAAIEASGRTTVAVEQAPMLERARALAQEAPEAASPQPASLEAAFQTAAETLSREPTLGKLAHDIPPRMVALVPRVVSVTLSRLLSEKLVADLHGGAAAIHDVRTYAAMTVRLKAPGGGFKIEPQSDETQWVDRRGEGLDATTTWRWSVTPEKTGQHELVLLVQGREFRDGIEAGLPAEDQKIRVLVDVNTKERAWSVAKWAAVAIGGGVLSWLGQVVGRMAF